LPLRGSFTCSDDLAGRGLSNIRSRASLIGAQVEWRCKDEGGTRFALRKAGQNEA
jgi:signal transduction histidine kinase